MTENATERAVRLALKEFGDTATDAAQLTSLVGAYGKIRATFALEEELIRDLDLLMRGVDGPPTASQFLGLCTILARWLRHSRDTAQHALVEWRATLITAGFDPEIVKAIFGEIDE